MYLPEIVEDWIWWNYLYSGCLKPQSKRTTDRLKGLLKDLPRFARFLKQFYLFLTESIQGKKLADICQAENTKLSLYVSSDMQKEKFIWTKLI